MNNPFGMQCIYLGLGLLSFSIGFHAHNLDKAKNLSISLGTGLIAVACVSAAVMQSCVTSEASY